MRVVLAKTAVERLRTGERPRDVAVASVEHLGRRGRGNGGIIMLAADGTPAVAFTTSRMAYAYINDDGSYVVGPSETG